MTTAASRATGRAATPAPRELPTRTRSYLSYLFDSRNWDGFAPRDGDVVISTSYKSGTTWMQNIVLNLIFAEGEIPAVSEVSPWLDRRNPDIAETLAMLEAQPHRRVIKSHLPLDVLPYHACVRYIVVVRDPRDVFMSFCNHYANFTDDLYARMNDPAVLIGPPLPRFPTDIHLAWGDWINRGWFPDESEGYPSSANMGHTATWWRHRHLENIRFVHFNDLLADLEAEIDAVAAYLGIALAPERRAAVAAAVRFDAIKRNAAKAAPMNEAWADRTWTGGLDTFFFKGTNGRWRDVLTAEELAMYERAKARVLTADCAAYVEAGRAAWTDPAAPRSHRAEALRP